jgi:hypothetical protein
MINTKLKLNDLLIILFIDTKRDTTWHKEIKEGIIFNRYLKR